MNIWAKRNGHNIRLTNDAIRKYKGGRSIQVLVEDDKLVITKGYDYTLTYEGRGGAHFGARPLLREVDVPTTQRMRVDTSADKIVIYLKEVANG